MVDKQPSEVSLIGSPAPPAPSVSTLAKINEARLFLAEVKEIPNCRKLLAMAKGFVMAARNEYKATKTIEESKENKEVALDTAINAAELRLLVEARLGELIQLEQEVGRLATSVDSLKQYRSNNNVTTVKNLKDYGLTKMDSSRAQKIARHQDLIPEVTEKAKGIGDIPTRKALEGLIQKPLKQEMMKPKFDRLKELEEQGIYIGSVWDFGKRTDYAGSGSFHGNSIPQIVENAILLYSQKGDIILDPMAGSGTTIDVCRQFERQCLASDIVSHRDDIKEIDARQLDIQTESIDFIFLHPPYWKLVTYSPAGKYPNDISRFSYETFLDAISNIAKESHRVLKTDKVIAVLIGDLVSDGIYYPIAIETFNRMCQANFSPMGIAIKTTENSKSQILKGRTIWAELAMTKNLKIEHDFVLVFRKNGSN